MSNFTTISGSNITDLNGTKLALGTISFLGTDSMDQPISFMVGGGGQALKRPYASPVIAGVITSFTVPDPGSTMPAGIYYRVTVVDSSSGKEVLRYTLVSFTGATFNFDNYAPTGASAGAPLTGTSVTGPLSVTGNISATGTVSGSNIAGGQIATGTGTTNKLPKYTNGPSAVIGDSSITDNGTTVSTTEPLTVGSGAVGAPSLSFTSSATTGFWRQAADVIGVSVAGVLKWLINAVGPLFGSGEAVVWSSNADPSLAAGDSFLARIGAKILGIGSTNGGTDGEIRLAKINKVTITQPATSSTLTIADGKTATVNNSVTVAGVDGKTITVNNSLTFAGTDGTTQTFQGTGTVVNRDSTDTLTNKTLQGAGSGNAVTLLNTQGPISALVGNSADQTVYTFTIPANTIQAGKGFRIKMVGFHSTGTASVTYKIIVGATTTATVSSTSGNTANWSFSMYNNAGVQNSQYYEATAADGTTANMVNTFGTCAENFANAITVKFTFNVANTDQYTGKLWAVELIQ